MELRSNTHHRRRRSAFVLSRFLTVAIIVGCAAAFASPSTVRLASTRMAPGSGLPTTGTVLPRYSPAYIGSRLTMTQAQAITVAQQFDLIVAEANSFGKYVSVMKAANPLLRILVDFDGSEDTSTGGTGFPASWYATSSTGARIHSNGFGFYLMNPANPLWGANLGQRCAAAIAKSHYDGCFLDSMGTAPLGAGYCSALPINPSTGAVWTASDWLAANTATAARAQAVNPGALIAVNGLADGVKYFASGGATSTLLGTSSSVAMAEIWGRLEGQPVTTFRTEAKWLLDVNMLVDAEARGDSVLAVTKLWVSATAAQQAAWHKFTLATFLLGANGHSYYSFVGSKTNAALTQDYAWDHINIGTPLGPYAKVGGLYQRSFTNGIVVVNPTTAAATLNLSATYTNLDGSLVTSETFAPDTADIFLLG
jgi:Hypothetical glycosyl hydrolase family 15